MAPGEVRDTADLDRLSAYLVDRVLSRTQRLAIFRSFGRLGHVWPNGGTRVWGAAAAAAVAAPPTKASGASSASATPPTPATVDADGALELLAAEARPAFMALLRGEFAFGARHCRQLSRRARPRRVSGPSRCISDQVGADDAQPCCF